MPMDDITRLLIVPHTHWDREWYQTFQQFRMRLVRTVDAVLDVLDADPGFSDFMLDGQTIVLDDYLEIRPENAARLQRLARAGRIQVGPWYLQPDEFLVGGESLVRNLQVGLRMAEGYGGAMRIGYVPDIFGHIAQLPQILRGFGLDNAVFWRGVGPDVERSEWHWAAPDGTSVLVVWLCDPAGYSNARTLPLETGALVERVERLEASLAPRATTHTLLLMNGSDHLAPQVGLPKAIAAANERLAASNQQLVIGTLPQYVAAIQRADPSLATYTGEMRSSRYAHLLPGVLSTRMWIKQRNAACEALLTRCAEPQSAWAWLLTGAAYPLGLLRASWIYLLQNHPHDSICGCSIDQVHEEMRPRFDQSEQIAAALTEQALDALATGMDTRQPATTMDPTDTARAIPIVVFNPGPGPRTDLVRCSLTMPAPAIALVDETGQPVPFAFERIEMRQLLDQRVSKEAVPSLLHQVHEGRVAKRAITQVTFSEEPATAPDSAVERVMVTLEEGATPDQAALAAALDHMTASAQRADLTGFHFIAHEARRADLLVLARDVPAHGARTYYARPRNPRRLGSYSSPSSGPMAAAASPSGPMATMAWSGAVAPANAPGAAETAIENVYFRVEADSATGTLTLHDKRTNTVYPGLNQFDDGGDVGDLYNYSPPATDTRITRPTLPPAISTLRAGVVRSTLRVTLRYALPAHCASDRASRGGETVECAITSEVSLVPGVRRVEIRTTVENQARDHRLRVLFPAPLVTDVSDAEGAFQVVRRPIRQPRPVAGEPPWSEWAEMPVDTHPQKRFVDVSDGRAGLAVLNRGLPEYEVMPEPAASPDRSGVTVALTLLRCIEWLSRDDLATRHGHAGPPEFTPLAQNLGIHVFEYALVPHPGDWLAGDALAQAQAFETPLRARATQQHAGSLPALWSSVSTSPASVVVSAIKRAETEDSLIVRVYNAATDAVNAELRLVRTPREVARVTLNEEALPPGNDGAASATHLDGATTQLPLRGGEIATLRFRF